MLRRYRKNWLYWVGTAERAQMASAFASGNVHIAAQGVKEVGRPMHGRDKGTQQADVRPLEAANFRVA